MVDGVEITFAECSGNGLHSITNTAHAAKIVRRCNSHDALVAALERIEDASRSVRTVIALQHIGEWAREALKAARGEA